MSARAEWEPLTWEEAEGNRRSRQGARRCHQGSGKKRLAGTEPLGWIRHELERSRESVEEVRSELVQCRDYLQTWTAGESPESRANLPGLAEASSMNHRVEHFLVGWLAQLEERLEVTSQGVESLAKQAQAQQRALSPPLPAVRQTGHR
jgi:hypothetical protein